MVSSTQSEVLPSPAGDSQYHLSADELRAGFEALAAPPTESSTLGLIVQRLGGGIRATPSEAQIDAAEGLVGDRWKMGELGAEDQITIMRADIGELIANGQEQSLFGDNLIIDLDLSKQNLPTGSRIAIGDTLTEVTEKPHNGCAQYVQRFGRPALRLVNGEEFEHLRLRGLHVRVLDGGVIRVGDSVKVLRS